MDTFGADYWRGLLEEVIPEGRKHFGLVLNELAPKGYFPLEEPAPRSPPEEMDMDTFLKLPAEKQRYYLRRMTESGRAS